MTTSDAIDRYADLQWRMHDALRAQHPEWIEPDGTSPICDDYDARFAKLLNLFCESYASKMPVAGRRNDVESLTCGLGS